MNADDFVSDLLATHPTLSTSLLILSLAGAVACFSALAWDAITTAHAYWQRLAQERQREADEAWAHYATILRISTGMGPQTVTEIEAELDATEAKPMSEEQVERIMAKVNQMIREDVA